MSDTTADDDMAALTEALIRPLVRCSALPDWMQIPALGRDMRPLAEYLAVALAPVVVAARAEAWGEGHRSGGWVHPVITPNPYHAAAADQPDQETRDE